MAEYRRTYGEDACGAGSQPGGEWELVEREIPEPGPGKVRVKVQACGICHSDSVTKDGLFPGIQYPRVPGHEIVGVVDKLGEGAQGWKVGQRVGIEWHGGNCGYCHNCRRGNFFACTNGLQTTGITFDGGYAEYVVAPSIALAEVPEGLSAVEAAPLMCAGLTTFNCLRNTGARPGDVVAVLGLGGLGHLGVQYAAKMGFRTVAIARGADKAELAKKLGADVYIDNQAQDPSAELQKLEWSEGRSRHGDKCGCDGVGDGWLSSERHVHDCGRSAEGRGSCDAAAAAVAVCTGLVLRNLDRFGGHAELQPARGSSFDERGL